MMRCDCSEMKKDFFGLLAKTHGACNFFRTLEVKYRFFEIKDLINLYINYIALNSQIETVLSVSF